MSKTITAVFLCLSAVSVKGFLSWLLLSALLLQLSEPVSDALPFGRSWRSALFFHLSLPVSKVTVILFHNGFRFPIGCHECLHIGITVLPENIGELIQPFGYFRFGLLYPLCKSLALLAFENALCLAHDTAEQIRQPAAFADRLTYITLEEAVRIQFADKSFIPA